jgi:hypothetical protein
VALSESGLASQGVMVTPPTYGGAKRKPRARKGPARGSTAVRKGGKQSLYVKPRGRRR